MLSQGQEGIDWLVASPEGVVKLTPLWVLPQLISGLYTAWQFLLMGLKISIRVSNSEEPWAAKLEARELCKQANLGGSRLQETPSPPRSSASEVNDDFHRSNFAPQELGTADQDSGQALAYT